MQSSSPPRFTLELIPSLLYSCFLAALVMAAQPLSVLSQDQGHKYSPVRESAAQARHIYIVGAVMKPGGYVMPANGKITLLQGLTMAKGIDPVRAPRSAVIIRHWANGSSGEIHVDLHKMLQGAEPDIELFENDIVFVGKPERRDRHSGPRDLPSLSTRRA